MRQAVLLIIVLFVFLQAYYRRFVPACPDRASEAVDCQRSSHGDEDVEQVALVGMEDRVLRQHLAEQGTLLLDQGLTADMDALIKQLNVDRCQLNLPVPEVVASDPVALYAKARDSVVVVCGLGYCDKCHKLHPSTASGFLISSSGAIVTNYHVVDNPEKKALVVMTADRHVYPVKRVLAADRAEDLAILQIDAENLSARPLPLAPEPLPVGSPVSVISHPDGRYFCFTSGVVSRHETTRSYDETVERLLITADFGRGSSGAPVFNSQGQVVGIVKSTDSVYYLPKNDDPKRLQMVFKICVPSTSLRKLIEG
jgi:hypothetical protein